MVGCRTVKSLTYIYEKEIYYVLKEISTWNIKKDRK